MSCLSEEINILSSWEKSEIPNLLQKIFKPVVYIYKCVHRHIQLLYMAIHGYLDTYNYSLWLYMGAQTHTSVGYGCTWVPGICTTVVYGYTWVSGHIQLLYMAIHGYLDTYNCCIWLYMGAQTHTSIVYGYAWVSGHIQLLYMAVHGCPDTYKCCIWLYMGIWTHTTVVYGYTWVSGHIQLLYMDIHGFISTYNYCIFQSGRSTLQRMVQR